MQRMYVNMYTLCFMRDLRCHGQPMAEAHVFCFLVKESLCRRTDATTKRHNIVLLVENLSCAEKKLTNGRRVSPLS